MADYNFIISNQIETITALENKLGRTVLVAISFYHPASRGINSDSDPTKTAIMRKPTVGKTVAISDQLLKEGWMGLRIYLDQYGVFVAEDKMGVDKDGKPIEGRRIDICVASEEEAFRRGIKHNVIAVKL